MRATDSILDTVKHLLGVESDYKAFDIDILTNINAAFFTLKQIGVGPKEGFSITSNSETFLDFFKTDTSHLNEIAMYLFYKTRLGFDPPTGSAVLECLKEMVKEIEWRLNVENDTIRKED